ncbi:MAG: HNH endonuclease [Galactobacter sp.]
MWRGIRKRAIRAAKQDGLISCPICRVHLDYDEGQRPNSAEVDHIVPHSQGGPDHISNVRVICRRCNQRRGDGLPRGRKRPIRRPVASIDFGAE